MQYSVCEPSRRLKTHANRCFPKQEWNKSPNLTTFLDCLYPQESGLDPHDQQDKDQEQTDSRQKCCCQGLVRPASPNPRPKRGFLLVGWILAGSLAQSLLCKLLKDMPSAKVKPKGLLVSLKLGTCSRWGLALLTSNLALPDRAGPHHPGQNSRKRGLLVVGGLLFLALVHTLSCLVCGWKFLQPSHSQAPEVAAFAWSWTEHFW